MLTPHMPTFISDIRKNNPNFSNLYNLVCQYTLLSLHSTYRVYVLYFVQVNLTKLIKHFFLDVTQSF